MTVALVTGGNGFLGTAVIDALIAQGITSEEEVLRVTREG